jgi:hypothetical protein
MTTVQPGTTIEVSVSSWSVKDDVVQLRVRGTDRIYPLPSLAGGEPPPNAHWLVGSSPQCELHLEDPGGRIAPRHAVLIRHDERWILVALGPQELPELERRAAAARGQLASTPPRAPAPPAGHTTLQLLGMEPTSLRRWIGPRELPWLAADRAWDAN